MVADKVKVCIKDSARELFRRYGYNKTNVNEIARDAKVAKATIYKHFESKEMILHAILMDYISKAVKDLVNNLPKDIDLETYLSNLILKVSRLSYTICNEFVGWDFIRESANAQEYLKTLSDDLENLLIQSFRESDRVSIPLQNLRFLVNSSKSIVFSFAFTSVSVADVRKNFVSFQNDMLPFLVKAAIA